MNIEANMMETKIPTAQPSIVPAASTRPIEWAGNENARLTREIARLAQENEDLRESARIWIWLYEKQLDRANKAVAELQTLAPGRAHLAA